MIDRAPWYLLMIEPTSAPTAPIVDDVTRAAAHLLATAEKGTHDGDEWDTGYGYRGVHSCTGAGCLAQSDNYDHRVAGTVITHSLLVHLVACHRADCDPAELARILELAAGGRAEPSAHVLAGTQWQEQD